MFPEYFRVHTDCQSSCRSIRAGSVRFANSARRSCSLALLPRSAGPTRTNCNGFPAGLPGSTAAVCERTPRKSALSVVCNKRRYLLASVVSIANGRGDRDHRNDKGRSARKEPVEGVLSSFHHTTANYYLVTNNCRLAPQQLFFAFQVF